MTTQTKAPARSCGSCRLCCDLLAVPAIEKPEGKWCEHACGKGCAIYATRPEECAEYQCLWLQSQSGHDGLEPWPARLRPDRSGIVFDLQAEGHKVVVARFRDPRSVRRPDVFGMIRGLQRGGVIVAARTLARTRRIMDDGTLSDDWTGIDVRTKEGPEQ